MRSGQYMMDADSLKRFRDAIVDDKKGKELETILASLAKKGFLPGAYESAKRVPKGYDPEHPRAERLKMKGLTVTFPETQSALLTSAKLVTHIAKQVKTAAPLVEWLSYATS
jgi:uncharacterized protein (DUF2461 family)